LNFKQKLTIIQYILNRRIEKIKPSIEHAKIKYEILSDMGLTDISIFNELVSEGIMKKKVFATVVKCNACGSFYISSFYKCPFCGSILVEGETIATHTLCGYTGTLSTFKEGNKEICPVCKREIKKSDLNLRAHVFTCKSCGKNFVEGRITHYCNDCGNKFDPSSETYNIETIYYYEIDKSGWEKITKLYKPWINIYDFLIENGFILKDDSKIKGESGIEHDFDLVFKKNDKYSAFTYVNKLTIEDLLRFHIKTIDAKNVALFIVTNTKTDKQIEDFSRKYGINLLSFEDKNVIKSLEMQLKELKFLD